MDELQISGKRYISARRAAKENGYHSDYIGQLIRGGKLKGQKVGRAWYVAEDSLASYLGNEAPVAEATPVEEVAEIVEEVVAETPIAQVVAEATEETTPEVVKETATNEEIEKVVEAIEEEVAEEEFAEETEQEVTESEQEYRIPIRTPDTVAQRSGGLTYVQDEVSLRVPIEKKSVVHTMPTMVVAEQASLISERDIRPVRRNGGGVLALTIVGMVVLFAFAALSSATVFEATVETGQPASTGYSISW